MRNKVRAILLALTLCLGLTVSVAAPAGTASALPSSCSGVGLGAGFTPQKYGVKCTSGSGQYQAVAMCTYPRQATRYYVSYWGTAGPYASYMYASCPIGWSVSTSGSYWNLRN